MNLHFLPRVRRDVRAAIDAAVAKLPSLSPVRHAINVTVVPHKTVATSDGVTAWACIFCPRSRTKPVEIYVAAGLAEVVERESGSRRHGVEAVVLQLLHEFAHYEQWRDGRALTERGVVVRARNLFARTQACNS